MSKLIRKADSNNSHLKGAFSSKSKEQDNRPTTGVRVAVDVKEELNYIVTIEKHGSVNNLIEQMLELYKNQMSEENINKLKALIK